MRHHATGHDEDLDEGGVFEKNELFPPNVMRSEDLTDQEVRASLMVRSCNVCTMLICRGMLNFNECTHLLN
jgi:hypothetical protein